MLYQKNLPVWERLLRTVLGLAIAIIGLVVLKPTLWGYVTAAGGAGIILTGFFGFCPMCAMVGRKSISGTK